MLRTECIPQLSDAVVRIPMDMRPQEAHNEPTFALELVGLSIILDALAQGGMEFQAVGVNQYTLRCLVREVGARNQPSARIVDLMLFQRFR